MLAKESAKAKVYLDGRVIAEVKSGRAFAEEVRKNRRLGVISGEINVSYEGSLTKYT